MTVIIPILYATLLGYWLYRDKRFRLRSLPCYTVTVLFLLKCLLGVAYMLFHQKFYDGGDTMKFIRDGQIVYNTLGESPMAYLRLTFGPNAVELPASFQPQLDAMGFWGDTSAYMMVRFNAAANLFTWGHEFGNVVLMALLSTLGMVALMKAFRKVAELPALLLIPFLLPSMLFWTSGIHKESLLLFTLGISVWGLAKLSRKIWSVYAVIAVAVGFGLTYLIRDFIFFLMIPALIAMMLSRLASINKLYIYGGVYLLALIAGLWLPVFNGENYLHLIANKQQQFMALEAGNSHIEVTKLEPTVMGMLKNLPQAIVNTLLGPFFLSPKGMIHIVAIIDNAVLWLIFLWAIFRVNRAELNHNAMSLFIRMLGLSYLILIGYIVPNIGAISRYRSLAIILILLSLTVHIAPHKAVHK